VAAEARACTAMALPRAPTLPKHGRLRPWRPRALRTVDFTGYRYVVIDEIEGNWAVLAVTDWPGVDRNGRLRFPLDEPTEIYAETEPLLRFLREHRRPASLAARELRHGDAFAIEVLSKAALGRAAADEPVEPEKWIRPPVYDVTRDARREAKVAFYSAVSEPLALDQALEVLRANEGSGGGA
jgi:hypothetical protein